MKTRILATVVAFIFTLSAALTSRSAAQDLQAPVGWLTTGQTHVQAGTKPTLSWGITYPAVIKDIITITPPGTCTPKKKVTMDVRVIGASVKVVWKNSWGVVTRWEWAETKALVSINNGTYSSIFSDTQDNVKANKIVYTKTVNANQPINFGGHYFWDNKWTTIFKSTNTGDNVVALVNGDTPPTTTPLYQQPTIEDFIKPYLDGAGRIKIGPMDVIYLMELTHTDKRDSGFDLQDLALLVTFKTAD